MVGVRGSSREFVFKAIQGAIDVIVLRPLSSFSLLENDSLNRDFFSNQLTTSRSFLARRKA